ncbi:MAG: pyrimidine 5'-nucleotidase [Proteobacteria bacterium]|nr:pyrimidine 5'-nucleotidase [Pseudomonadota bacterium]HQR04907.1 pyrimidine 5'-nucleotidase [Rhodocyclaceae bacterium]
MHRVWLFDLDNTLHDASSHIFPHINRAMTAYLAQVLCLSEPEANRMRLQYWRRYGATLTGMMRNHGTDPHHFLHHTHQFPDLASMVVHSCALDAMLKRLPGRKIVFSNAPVRYADAVLRILGIRRRFSSVWTIERLRFRPKPDPFAFHRLLRTEAISPARCVMIEDTADNLRTAKILGMQTVLISSHARVQPYVDVRLQSVLDLPRHLDRLAARPARPAGA